MAGGIALSAKFDVSIAEPLDSKLESVSTFSELASTEFPYKGMQKLVEDEGDNGIIYHLGTDLTTWSTSTDEDALKQGDNTLTETLKLGPFSALSSFNTLIEVYLTSISSSCTEISTGDISSNVVNVGNVVSTVQKGGDLNELLISAINGIVFKSEILGRGIKFNDIDTDEANVDFSTDDNNLLSIGKSKENLQQKHTVTDFTDAFTIPNGTNNATLTMTNAIDKDVTITATSFANVGDACELSSLLGVGYPIVVADTGVTLVDPNSVAPDAFNIKGLRRMNDLSGIVQIQVY